MSLDYDSPYYDHNEEIRTTPGPIYPRYGSKAEAEERGYDPRDKYED